MNKYRIIIIGAGKVSAQLGNALIDANHSIVQIFNRTKSKAASLARKWGAQAIDNFDSISPNADLYIIAVKDDAIEDICNSLEKHIPAKSLVVHVSGATPSTLLAPYFANHGIFYPLQTFSTDKKPDFKSIPLCINASNQQVEKCLLSLANSISDKVFKVDDQQRVTLHTAAVFANNFSNHLFHIAQQILKEANLPFDLLVPLIEETVEKIKIMDPKEAQTGPARRNDQKTITKHLELLQNHPQFYDVYQVLTQSIMRSNDND